MFLMYRVELKDALRHGSFEEVGRTVPNVPCGVESSTLAICLLLCVLLFLMYRVELKVFLLCSFYGRKKCASS